MADSAGNCRLDLAGGSLRTTKLRRDANFDNDLQM